MKLKSVDLFKAMNFAGKNFGEKLDTARCQGLRIEYDEKSRIITANYNKRIAHMSIDSVAFVVELDEQEDAPKPVPISFMGKVKAQVSTPMNIKERE
jgi:hypothetical protein